MVLLIKKNNNNSYEKINIRSNYDNNYTIII